MLEDLESLGFVQKLTSGYWKVSLPFQLNIFAGCVYSSSGGLNSGGVNLIKDPAGITVNRTSKKFKYTDKWQNSGIMMVNDVLHFTMDRQNYGGLASVTYNIIALS